MQKRVEQVLRDRLREFITLSKRRNQRLSMRSISKILEVSPSTLSLFLSRKRRLSPDMVMRLSSKLNLAEEEKQVVEAWRLGLESPKGNRFPPLKKAKWLHFLILSLLQTDLVEHQKANQILVLSKRLDVSTARIERLVQELIRSGLILEEDKKLSVSMMDGNFKEEGNLLIRNINREILAYCLSKMDFLNDPETFNSTDFSAITIPTTDKLIPQIKQKIEKFQLQLSSFADKGVQNDCIINLSIQMVKF